MKETQDRSPVSSKRVNQINYLRTLPGMENKKPQELEALLIDLESLADLLVGLH